MSVATELREAELGEIERDKALQWQKEIADPFLAILRHYLPDSAKK